MAGEGILTGLTGLLGGYVQGQRIKEAFDREREELTLKKKHVDIQEQLMNIQLYKALQGEDVTGVAPPGSTIYHKRTGQPIGTAPQPQFNLRDALIGVGAIPSQAPPSEAMSPTGEPPPGQGAGLQIPSGATVTSPGTPGHFPTVKYDPIAAAQEQRRIVAEGKVGELQRRIVQPGVNWQDIQNEARNFIDIPQGKALHDLATRQIEKEGMHPLANVPDNVLIGVAEGAVPQLKLPDGTVLTKENAKKIVAGKERLQAAYGTNRALAFIGGGLQLSGLTPDEINAQVEMAAKSIVGGERSIQDMETLIGPRNWSVLGPRVTARINELTGGKGPPAALDANATRILVALGPARGETQDLRQLLEPFRTINNAGYFAPWRLLYAAGVSPGTPAATAAEAQARQEASTKFFRNRYESLNTEQQTKVDNYLELGRRIADFELNRINAMMPYFRAAGGRPNEMFQEMVKKHITELWKDSPQLLFEKLTTINRQFDRMEEAVRTYGRKTGVPATVPPPLSSPPAGGGAGISVPTPSGMATVTPRQ